MSGNVRTPSTFRTVLAPLPLTAVPCGFVGSVIDGVQDCNLNAPKTGAVPVESTGSTGPVGNRGTTGPIGSTGYQGLPNSQTGSTGPMGPTGATGRAGRSGRSGHTGDTGNQGTTGNTGATGSVGAAGANGVQGPTGPTGAGNLITSGLGPATAANTGDYYIDTDSGLLYGPAEEICFGSINCSSSFSFLVAYNGSFGVGFNEFSIQLWVYPRSFASNQILLSGVNADGFGNYDDYFYLQLLTSGQLRVRVGFGPAYYASSGLSLTLNTWSFINIGRDSFGDFYGYINGSYQFALSANSFLAINQLWIGSAYFGQQYDGLVTDVRFNTVFTVNPTIPSVALTSLPSSLLLLNAQTPATFDQDNSLTATPVGNAGTIFSTSSPYVVCPIGFPNAPVNLKTFVIDHPLNQSKYLVHACLEGPEAGVFYRGISAIVQVNEQGIGEVEVQLPNYVSALASNFTVSLTSIQTQDQDEVETKGYQAGLVADNKFKVFGPKGCFSWLVLATRAIFDTEPSKDDVSLEGQGPYKWLQNL